MIAAISSSKLNKPNAPLPPAAPLPTSEVLGVRFHRLWMDEVMAITERFIEERRPRQICLANAHTVALARHDSAFKDLLAKSDLVLADGMSIVWGGRWIGAQIPCRIAGPDLMVRICERSEERGYRLFLLGSGVDNLADLKWMLLKRWPGLQIVGLLSPSMCDRFEQAENDDILAQIRDACPDVLFVGMSCPKQEKWIAENLERIAAPVSLGVGAAFNFLSGKVPRAPEKLQKAGLEWLYRLYHEPRRLWRRYLLGNAVFLSSLAAEVLRNEFRPKSQQPNSDKRV
jgi:N-acetylglucosaminyldiphosphoundecaprenol N-acetyl-beta-D-mannosaminyltransferase